MNNLSGNFVHLHVHTEYSVLGSSIRISDLMARAKEHNMPAVAITDNGTMFGVMDFYIQAVNADIKPIIGCEFYVAPDSLPEKIRDHRNLTHLVLLAENMEGYRNLCRIATAASIDGLYSKPSINKAILSKHHKGLIALSGCLKGEIPGLIIIDRIDVAEEAARLYLGIFGEGNFFLELQDNKIKEQKKVNNELLKMSERLSIPLVATNDCHYLDADEKAAHEVLLCIQAGKTLKDDRRITLGGGEYYFKSADEMKSAFAGYPGAVENTIRIANRCNVEFEFNKLHAPKFSPDAPEFEAKLFEKKTRQGYEARMKKLKKTNPGIDETVYKQRIDYEIDVINALGFHGYFLIVADFIEYAKQHKILSGPGRGSAPGSLVAYALGITNIDPIEHSLIFERFLNPSQNLMPDIDIDFCVDGREKVYHYAVNRFGGLDYVSQIITYGRMKNRNVIREVGSALDLPSVEVDEIVNLVPEDMGMTLEKALKIEPRFREKASANPEIGELFKISTSLEGLIRHTATHAAGFVIGDKPLLYYMPMYKRSKGEIVTQFDKNMIEKMGLITFDFLGLRNLTIMSSTLSLINSQGKTPPDLNNIVIEDSPTYELLSTGLTDGIFQIESDGMKALIKKMKPDCFSDIIALGALYRPAPLGQGMHEAYIERKQGCQQIQYLIPELEPILGSTYGLLLYQEQVMKIAADIAGFSMVEADSMRRILGKKKTDDLTHQQDKFVKGAMKNGISFNKAEKLFGVLGSSFDGSLSSKAHNAAYALITFQSAYLKTHFPAEFMATVLNSEINFPETVKKYLEECRIMGIDVLQSGDNVFEKQFTVMDDKISY